MYPLKKIYYPEYFQGRAKKRNYFEGWYYKVVTRESAFSVIPGISINSDDPHAFIQVNRGKSRESSYYRFPLSDFSYTKRHFSISIGKNSFSLEGFDLDTDDTRMSFKFSEIYRWPFNSISPGTMGPYSIIPFMECKHGIIVLDARARGIMDDTDIDQADFYLEKDYGRSFPQAWIWIQSNSFSNQANSISLSIAKIPFLGKTFTGFILGLLVDGQFFNLSSYTGAKIKTLDYNQEEIIVLIQSGPLSLDIKAKRCGGASLSSPVNGAMVGKIDESLDAELEVTFKDGPDLLFQDKGFHSGLELVNPEKL